MKYRLLLSFATGTLTLCGAAGLAIACDDAKTGATSAAAKPAARTAPASTDAMMKTKGVAAMTASSTGTSACCAHGAKTTATTASAKGACASKTSATTANAKACKSGESQAVYTSTDGIDAVPAGSGYSCGGKGASAAAGRHSHEGCDACADMSDCDGELKASGALTQTVKLKNGIMYVYTTQDPGKVRTVQAAVSHRIDRLASLRTTDKAKLCPECKMMRGAIASGKMTREMVTIEGGCLTLVTSTDPAIVAKLHAMVANHTAARIKT
jgi:hypothetical protein